MSRILELLGFHQHYWGNPYKNEVGRLVQTCYYCTTDRKVKAQI